MTIEELEQLKADGMIDDRKYQQMKAQLSMQDYQPNQNPMQGYTPSNQGYNVGADSTPYEQSEPTLYDRGGMQSVIASQEIERGNKIRELEAQIEQVKERIARNKRALTGKSYEDVNKKLASLEMGKIGLRLGRQNATPDPTMLWRWNQQRLDTNAANNKVNGQSVSNFNNKMAMMASQRLSNSTEGREQQIRNIESAIVEGQNLGADVQPLIDKKKEIENSIYGGSTNNANTNFDYGKGTDDEKIKADVDNTIAGAKTSSEIAQYRSKMKGMLTPEQENALNDKQRELEKKEVDKAKAQKFEDYLKSRGYKNGSKGLSPKILATLKRQYGG